MKANYFKFGVFLVVAMGMIVVAVVVLGAGLFEPEGEYFETYFDRSVHGLSPGAPVEVQGVEIGQIESIQFANLVYPQAATMIGGGRLVRVTNTHLQELLARPQKDRELANIAVLVDELNTTMRRVNLLIATQAPRIEGSRHNGVGPILLVSQDQPRAKHMRLAFV